MTYRTIKLTTAKKGLVFDREEDPYAPFLGYDTKRKMFTLYDWRGSILVILPEEDAKLLVEGINQMLEIK